MISAFVFKMLTTITMIIGPFFPSVSVASWMGLAHEFVAGAKATLLILPKDAFGNNISSTSREPDYYNFTVFASYLNGSIASVPNITYMGWNEFGYVSIEFIATKSGSLLLNVAGGNKTLTGSPLTFNVNPGNLLQDLHIYDCTISRL